jgi:hypothetical protein
MESRRSSWPIWGCSYESKSTPNSGSCFPERRVGRSCATPMKPGARVRQIRPVRSILSLRGCSPARRRVRPNIDPPEEPGGDTDPGLSAGGRAPHDRTRRRGGRWRLSHGRSPSRGRAGRASSSAVGAERADRSLAAFPVVFVITLGLVLDAQIGARWVRSWFAPGQPFLNYPSASNLRWLREAGFKLAETHDEHTISVHQKLFAACP